MSGPTLYPLPVPTSVDLDQVRRLRRVVDEHVISSGDGRCVLCGVEGPCWARWDALRGLARLGRLPVRRPGATRPELIGACSPGPGPGAAGSGGNVDWFGTDSG